MLRVLGFDHGIESIVVGHVVEETLHQEHIVTVSQLDYHRSHVDIDLHLRVEFVHGVNIAVLLSQSEHLDPHI